MRWAMAAGLAVTVTAGAAAAEGWTTIDLGDVATEARCVERAVRMFDRFGEAHGHHSTIASTWTVAGYDLIHDDFDGLVTCAHGPRRGARATLMVYGSGAGSDAQRSDIADMLHEIWEGR